MLAATLQMQPALGDIALNLQRIEAAAAAAAAMGATFLVAPEMAVTGYNIGKDLRSLAQPREGAIADGLAAIAHKQGIAVIAGFPEREGNAIYNAAALALPDGNRVFYRKCHLFGAAETVAFTRAADVSPLVTIGGLSCGMLICYDIEFPEWVRTLVLRGAELIITPSALPRSAFNNRVSKSVIPARALENHVFIAYAGLCGREGEAEYQGGSVIAGPDGETLARAGDGEALLIAKIDPERYLGSGLDPYLADRRPDLYGALSISTP